MVVADYCEPIFAVEALEEQNCLNPDGQGRPYSWLHISSLKAMPMLEKVLQPIRNTYAWHRIDKVGMVCFCTCRGWPTWPIQGSLMLQISKMGIPPILQERESDFEQGISSHDLLQFGQA